MLEGMLVHALGISLHTGESLVSICTCIRYPRISSHHHHHHHHRKQVPLILLSNQPRLALPRLFSEVLHRIDY